MKKLFVMILGTVLSFSALAENAWITSKIQKIYPLSSGGVVIMFTDDSPDCTNPNTPKYHYLVAGQQGVAEEAAERIYSALLTAAAANKTVAVNFESSSTSCYVNRAQVIFD